MDISLVVSLRCVVLLGIVASLAILEPAICSAAIQPFYSLWRRVKLFQIQVAARFKASRHERFWEIDMTKFEP